MRRMSARVLLAALAALAPFPLAAAGVRFEVNDAHVKDKAVPGVTLLIATAPGTDAALTARTDEDGIADVDLAPGTYWVSYVRSGYVPIGDSETEIRADGQVVTTTMSMLLEAEGGTARRRIRIVLNWGSRPTQVRDADAHAYCVCGSSDAHVYFADMRHENLGHVVELDVDDREWGGPETVTLSDPEPGSYPYWVHQYSRDEETLGQSDVVVRVFLDNTMAGEFRIPPELAQRTWKPFREIAVGPDLIPELIRWSAEELAADSHLTPPPDRLSEQSADGGSGFPGCCSLTVVGFVLAGSLLVLVIVRRRR